MIAVVAFSNNLGATFQRALLAIAGSVVGAALGILIIALLSGLATGFSFDNHPKTMVHAPSFLAPMAMKVDAHPMCAPF